MDEKVQKIRKFRTDAEGNIYSTYNFAVHGVCRGISEGSILHRRGAAMQFLTSIRDKIWDALFLDFYLDPHWTIRFKIMNLISNDALREYLTSAQYHLKNGMEGTPGGYTDFKRAAYWTNCAWDLWRK